MTSWSFQGVYKLYNKELLLSEISFTINQNEKSSILSLVTNFEKFLFNNRATPPELLFAPLRHLVYNSNLSNSSESKDESLVSVIHIKSKGSIKFSKSSDNVLDFNPQQFIRHILAKELGPWG
jgi:hypothetical protein